MRSAHRIVEAFTFYNFHEVPARAISAMPAGSGTRSKPFAHQEYNVEEIKSTQRIEEYRREGRDLFGRNIEVVKVDEAFFPSFFIEAAASQRAFFQD